MNRISADRMLYQSLMINRRDFLINDEPINKRNNIFISSKSKTRNIFARTSLKEKPS